MRVMRRISVHQKGMFLADAVFAASDGIVTTFAVVAGSGGASLSHSVILILGFANLFADGFSMAAGSFVAVESEEEFEESRGKDGKSEGSPLWHAVVTFISFNLFGLIPLMPFLFPVDKPYFYSTILVIVALFMVGFMKSFFTKRNFIKSGFMTLSIGGFAAFVAYISGYLIDKYII